MVCTLEEVKEYLRVDYDDENNTITTMMETAEKQCKDILRFTDSDEDKTAFAEIPNIKIAICYTVAYLFEHREKADHTELNLTLRSLLFGERKAAF